MLVDAHREQSGYEYNSFCFDLVSLSVITSRFCVPFFYTFERSHTACLVERLGVEESSSK